MLAEIGDFIGAVGFPVFVGVFVLIRMEPEIRKLRQAITSLMVVTAKSNGMAGKDVAEIVRLVAEQGHGRRVEDQVDATPGEHGIDEEQGAGVQ